MCHWFARWSSFQRFCHSGYGPYTHPPLGTHSLYSWDPPHIHCPRYAFFWWWESVRRGNVFSVRCSKDAAADDDCARAPANAIFWGRPSSLRHHTYIALTFECAAKESFVAMRLLQLLYRAHFVVVIIVVWWWSFCFVAVHLGFVIVRLFRCGGWFWPRSSIANGLHDVTDECRAKIERLWPMVTVWESGGLCANDEKKYMQITAASVLSKQYPLYLLWVGCNNN